MDGNCSSRGRFASSAITPSIPSLRELNGKFCPFRRIAYAANRQQITAFAKETLHPCHDWTDIRPPKIGADNNHHVSPFGT